MHFERLKYSYDKMGNISEIFKNGTLIVKYTYDTLNRIIREDTTATTEDNKIWSIDVNSVKQFVFIAFSSKK